jgi:hypothetical protein
MGYFGFGNTKLINNDGFHTGCNVGHAFQFFKISGAKERNLIQPHKPVA